MLNWIFAILMFIIFGKVFVFALKAAWGLSKIIFTVLLLPLFLIGLVIKGLIYLALPILVVLGIVFLVGVAERR